MTVTRVLVGPLAMLVLSAACGGGPKPAGDAEKGRQAFVEFHCNACHEVAGEALPPASVTPAVALGGRVLLPPSQERLREDILLPSSHFAVGYPREQITKGDRSRMPDYSKTLTEEQVTNLAAFLRSRYQQGLPTGTR